MMRNQGNGCRWDGAVRSRIRFLGVALPLLLALPAAKAFYLQVYQRDALASWATRQSKVVEKVAPRRGAIIDRNGQPLAISVPVPSIYAVREDVTEKGAIAGKLARVLDVDERTLARRLSRGNGFVWLKRRVEPEMAEKVRQMELPGVGIRTESRRYYPNMDLASAVLGFVGTDGGLEGLERSLEEHLRGGDGVRVLNLDARGKSLTSSSPWERHPAAGATVQLTLDRNIQYFVEQSLREGCIKAGARSGIAIVLESATGRILAMANYPGFSSRSGSAGAPVIAYWPALVDSAHITERVHVGGETIEVTPTSQLGFEEIYYQQTPVTLPPIPGGEPKTIPLGRLYGTRSGDKGGCANVGVWAKTDTSYAFLVDFLTVDRLKALCPDLAP